MEDEISIYSSCYIDEGMTDHNHNSNNIDDDDE